MHTCTLAVWFTRTAHTDMRLSVVHAGRNQHGNAPSRYLDHLSNAVDTSADLAFGNIFDRAIDFDSADKNFSGALSFGEFSTLVKNMGNTVRQTGLGTPDREQLKAWFDALDINGDGTVSKLEWYSFAIRESALGKDRGKALRGCFERFDKSGDGYLSLQEFRRACHLMGFGEVRV